jgi:hypothetical protein
VWPTLKPPFTDAVPTTGVFQYDPSSGRATADKELGQLSCLSRIPMRSGQRQIASAALMLDDAIYFTAPQTVSLSAMVSLEWHLVAMQPRDVAWVQAELKLENTARPEDTHTLVFVRQLLNARGQSAGEKHLFNVETTVPLDGGKRYRAVFLAKTVVETGGETVNLAGDEWKNFTPTAAEVVPASQVLAPDADARMHNESRAEVLCTLHFFKMR